MIEFRPETAAIMYDDTEEFGKLHRARRIWDCEGKTSSWIFLNQPRELNVIISTTLFQIDSILDKSESK